jgi:hypothetical protein
MEQAFKSMMNQSPSNAFGSNSPFPFAMPQQSAPTIPSSYPFSEPKKNAYKQAATVDVSATEVEATGTSEEADVAEKEKQSKKFGMDLYIYRPFPILMMRKWEARSFYGPVLMTVLVFIVCSFC